MKRMGIVIGIDPDRIAEYRRVHADIWPDVLERPRKSNIAYYLIFLRQPENLMFSYWEYTGDDFETDNAAIAADPTTRHWWKICGPMQGRSPPGRRVNGGRRWKRCSTSISRRPISSV